MGVRVETQWSYRGTTALILENELLRAVILPELGGKVWEITYKPADRQWLWHNPRVAPAPVPFGASFDDNFAGGWDELFPNDDPETRAGQALADHGELWSLPWTATIESAGPEAVIVLSRLTPVTPARVTRRITLREGEAKLRITQRITNLGATPFTYTWKLHPALAIAPGWRIDLPACQVEMDPALTGRVGHNRPFGWPGPTGVDLRFAPVPAPGLAELLYASDLAAGWCALTDPAARVGFGLAFPREVFPTCCIFASYGGWRGHYVAVLEPATGFPTRLSEAAARGRAARLAPGETVSATVVATCYAQRDQGNHISEDGEVS